MDKLYSIKVLVLKAVFCFLLAPLYALISLLFTVEDGFMYILLSIIPTGCLFTIPFWFSLVKIKKYRVSKIGKYIVYDSITCLIPAIFSFLFLEVVSTITNGKSSADGFVTLVFSVIFLIVVFIFWFMYWLFSYKENNRP